MHNTPTSLASWSIKKVSCFQFSQFSGKTLRHKKPWWQSKCGNLFNIGKLYSNGLIMITNSASRLLRGRPQCRQTKHANVWNWYPCIPVQFTVESYVSSGPIMNKYEQLWLLVGLRYPQGIGDVHVISQSSHSLGSAPVALRANSDTPGTANYKEVLGIALNIWWTHVTPHCGRMFGMSEFSWIFSRSKRMKQSSLKLFVNPKWGSINFWQKRWWCSNSYRFTACDSHNGPTVNSLAISGKVMIYI